MIYADTSALATLVVDEARSRDLRAWLAPRAGLLVTSLLTRVEITRMARRAGLDTSNRWREALDRAVLIPLDESLIDSAAQVPPPQLRSLDAIHLATALAVAEDLTAFVTYDRQLGRAALDAGLPVVAPGHEL